MKFLSLSSHISNAFTHRLAALLPVVLMLVLAGGCGSKTVLPASGAGGHQGSVAYRTLPPQGQKDRVAVVRTAQAVIGVPYKWGGASPQEGFDCSGFVWWVMRHNGLAVPRMTAAQASSGKAIAPAQAVAGDILVFRIGRKGLHTGIVSGGGTFIHSPKSGAAVREEPYTNGYWWPRLISVRRIVP
ncbi:C40 family peptidase [Oleidesulfovibrio sp.]|uniref:C40 family peptidase n=1 Tax=Oleidesulfovibrio sp. TaxID=2909707 RepID=UPI003A885022